MMKEKFITSNSNHIIMNMKKFLDIEYASDFEYIKKSGKSFIEWHPTGQVSRPLWEYYRLHNLPSYFVERGALPNTVVIDPNGFLVNSSSYNEENWNKELTFEELQQIENYINEFKGSSLSLEFQKSGRIDKEEFLKKLSTSDQEIIFVPLQLENDSVINYWSDWVVNVNNFQQIIKDLAKRNKDKIFVVKNHPLTRNKIQVDENIKIGDDFHYKDCIEYSSKIITINSGVGLQSMIWNKPVIIVGKSFYQFDGINMKANNISELELFLNNKIILNFEKIKRFLYFLKFVLYSDCKLIKTEKTRYENLTEGSEYINIRIFKKRNERNNVWDFGV